MEWHILVFDKPRGPLVYYGFPDVLQQYNVTYLFIIFV